MPIGHAPYGTDTFGGLNNRNVASWINENLAAIRSPKTQEMVNGLSTYMRGRSDKYSSYQQIVNSFANHFDDLKIANYRMLRNRFTQTCLPDTIDVIYTFKAPDTFSTVSVYDGKQWTDGNPSKYTDHESWWYNSSYNSIDEIKTNIQPFILLNRVSLQRNLTVPSIVYPSGIYVILEADDASFVNNLKGVDVVGTDIKIHGIDEYDVEREETFTFYYASAKRSLTTWKRIDSVNITYWDDPDKLKLTIANYFPSGYTLREDYIYSESKSDRNVKGVFWDISDDKTKLQLKQFVANDILQYHAGVKDFELIKEFALMKDDKNRITVISAILPSEVDSKLFVLSEDGALSVFNKYDDFSPLAKDSSNLRTNDPIVYVHTHAESGNLTIKGLFNSAAINRKVKSYRFSIVKADGTKLYYVNGTWQHDDDSFTPYAFIGNYGFTSPVIIYTEDDVFIQDMMLVIDVNTDYGTETDTSIVDSQLKSPVFTVGFPFNAAGSSLCYSDDGFLSVVAGSFHKVEFQNNDYLYDDSRGLVIFRNGFQTVKFFDENKTLKSTSNVVVSNVFSEIDQHGALIGIERKLGERAYQFLKRIKDAYYYPANSTAIGLVNAISRELILPVTDIVKITSSNSFDFNIKKNQITVNQNGNIQSFNLFNYDRPGKTLYNNIMDVVNWLREIGLTVDILDDLAGTLPARSLVEFNNITDYYSQDIPNSTRITLNIPDGAELITSRVKITGLDYVPTEVDLDNAEAGSFTVILPDTIITNKLTEAGNNLSYSVRRNSFTLKASQVIVSSILNDLQWKNGSRINQIPTFPNNFSMGYVSENVKQLIRETERVFPMRWVD